MTNQKLYPFSMTKHAHDIEFAKNRTFNLAHDLWMAGDAEAAERMDDLHDKYTALLCAVMDSSRDGRISWLTGPQLSLAKELVLWADNERHGRQRPAGQHAPTM